LVTGRGRRLEWALLALLFLIPCGALGVIDPTEARYAEIAREMVASHDFLVPRLDDLPHFDKPPVAYWALAAGVGGLGHNEWGARVALVVAALLALWLTGRVTRLAGGDDERVAIWMLAATPLFFILFHLASADPFLTTTVAAFHAVYLDAKRRRGWLPFV